MKCIACKEEIVNAAWKCIHCGTVQNWRRYLSLSSTVLALLVALLSVLTVFIPVVVDLVSTNSADIRTVLLSNGPTRLRPGHQELGGGNDTWTNTKYPYQPRILISNTGNGIGLIFQLCIDAKITFSDLSENINECKYFDDESEIIMQERKHTIIRPNFFLKHPAFPLKIENIRDGKIISNKVGPIQISGTIEASVQNNIGTSELVSTNVGAMNLYFTN